MKKIFIRLKIILIWLIYKLIYNVEVISKWLLGIVIISGIVMLSVIITYDMREEKLPLKEAAVFDKNGEEGVYSSVEIDFLEPILTKRNPATGELYSKYYLFGNSKTKEFGIASIGYIPDDLFENVETVLLYGDTSALSKTLRSDIVYQAEEDELYMLNKDDHYADEAFEAFSEKIGKIDRDSDFGKVFMSASFEPEVGKTPLNSFIKILGFVAMAVFVSAFQFWLFLAILTKR